MTKQKSRENAFLILFESSFREDTPEELFALAEELEEMEINDKVRTLVTGVLSETQELDTVISSYSPKRAVGRIARVNLILLRMAIYELRHFPETPVNVVISEAVRLSELYAVPEDTAFINGILGNYARENPGDKA